MFTITNVLSQKNIQAIVKYGEEKLEFPITPTISKSSRTELTTESVFNLVNNYVNYKGDEYKRDLFRLLKESLDNIMDTGYSQGIIDEDTNDVPKAIVKDLFDFLSLEDMTNYVKNVIKVKPLDVLLDEFDENMKRDGKGTRNQTYLKDDYLNFIALSMYFKISVLPVLLFGNIKQGYLNKINKEYMLLHFYKGYPIFKSEPIIKIVNWVNELIEKHSDEPNLIDSFVFSYGIPKMEMVNYILAIILFQRVFSYNYLTDGTEVNIINKIYKFVSDKLKQRHSATNGVTNKDLLRNREGEDPESILESYRVVSNLSYGYIEEFLWATKDIDHIIKQLPEEQRKHTDVKLAKNIKDQIRDMANEEITDLQIFILTAIFKTIIDSRAIYYLGIDNIINLIAVAFTYLWSIGNKSLALLIVSKKISREENVTTVSSIVNKERVSKDLKEELDILFPYQLPHADEHKNLALESIIDLSTEFYKDSWLPLCNKTYTEQGLTISNNINDENIRLELVKFVITNEKIILKEVNNATA